jgi:hypothetical protein
MWDPRRLTNLYASTACCRGSFALYFRESEPMLLEPCILLVSCFGLSLDQEDRGDVLTKHLLTFTGVYSAISYKTEHLLSTTVRTSNPVHLIHCFITPLYGKYCSLVMYSIFLFNFSLNDNFSVELYHFYILFT